MKTDLHTEPRLNVTENLAQGLAQLPDIGSDSIGRMLRKVSAAEAAIVEAQRKLDEAIADLAEDLTTEGDGWTLDEIWMTDLRGNAALMRRVREIAGGN